VKNTNKI